jgi:hypothetical protein
VFGLGGLAKPELVTNERNRQIDQLSEPVANANFEVCIAHVRNYELDFITKITVYGRVMYKQPVKRDATSRVDVRCPRLWDF